MFIGHVLDAALAARPRPSLTVMEQRKLRRKNEERKFRAGMRQHMKDNNDTISAGDYEAVRAAIDRNRRKDAIIKRHGGKVQKAKLSARSFINRAMIRADEKRINFNLHEYEIELQERLMDGCCEMTGIPFDFYTSGWNFDSPSLDRIDSNRGYVYDNVRFILHGMNLALNSWGEEKLFDVMSAWVHKKEQELEEEDRERREREAAEDAELCRYLDMAISLAKDYPDKCRTVGIEYRADGSYLYRPQDI